MKKVLLALLIAAGSGITATYAQNQVTNNSFEQGTDTVAANWVVNSGYVSRISQKTFNLSTGGTATQNAADGMYFMEIGTTIDTATNRATLGIITSKVAYTNRPQRINFNAMYLPRITSDRFAVRLMFTKFNSTSGNSEIVSNVIIGSTAGQQIYPWNSFSVPITYVNETIPDSLTLIVYSNHPQSTTVGATKLFIDNIRFSWFIGMEEHTVSLFGSAIKAYPNPMNQFTNIEYSVTSRENVRLTVTDIAGKEVATLVNETVAAGNHQVRFDRNGLKAGVYIYRLQAGDQFKTGKIIIAD